MQWWWGWRDRAAPEYDAGSGPVQANGWQNCGVGSEPRFFFNPALGHDRFHGCLGAAAIHVRGGRANTLRRTGGIGKQPAGVAMLAPQSAQCLIRQIGQRDETILMALAAPDMYLFALTVDIAHLQRQGLSEAQAHRIGYQQKGPVAQLACRTDQLFNLSDGESIGEGMNFGGFYDLYPLPVAFKDMLPEELEPITVNLDGTPGMGVNQFGKVFFALFQGQLIGAAIKIFTDSTYSPRVGVNGF